MSNQLDIVVAYEVDKKALNADVAVPNDSNIRKKEQEKLEKSQGLSTSGISVQKGL